MQWAASPHTRLTRVLHMGIAVLAVFQVLTSEFMTAPGKSPEEDLLFEVHEYSGLLAFALIFALWVTSLIRQIGTEPAVLVPWFSKVRLQRLSEDARRHLTAWRYLRIPEHGDGDALPAAIHGLGLLLMTAVSLTGAAWFVADRLGDMAVSWGTLAREIHESLAGLVIVYLIGHALAAALNQWANVQPLSVMWSLTRPTRGGRSSRK